MVKCSLHMEGKRGSFDVEVPALPRVGDHVRMAAASSYPDDVIGIWVVTRVQFWVTNSSLAESAVDVYLTRES